VILAWNSYEVAGCDIVVLVDADMRVMRFEAFHVQNLEVVKVITKAVVALRVNRQGDTAVAITSDGKVVFLPLPPFVLRQDSDIEMLDQHVSHLVNYSR
jgi:hypothetical protein